MEPVREPEYETSIEVSVPPATVWDLVTDVTRTPEWSPVVKRSEWLGDPAEAAVGARFKGHNRFNGIRWARECVVTAVEPERMFAFSTLGKDREQTRWRYRLESCEVGTRLWLAYEIVTVPRWVRVLRALPGGRSTNARQARWNLEESLRRIHDRLEARSNAASS